MLAVDFPRKPEGTLTLDLCFTCQGIWFDEFESLQLAPAGTLELFNQIRAHHDDPRTPWQAQLHCPRCRDPLMQGYDLCKYGKFSYHRCLRGHGRFTAFSAFLTEKGFVRQLNGDEIAELAKKVQIIRCSSCGAPVDIRTDTVCGHCRAPLAILDPQSVDKALERYGQAAAQAGKIDVLTLADAVLQRERDKSQWTREQRTHSVAAGDGSGLADLVVGGAALLFDLLS